MALAAGMSGTPAVSTVVAEWNAVCITLRKAHKGG